MNSHVTRKFRKCFMELPPEVQRTAVEEYRLWRSNPFHASLDFKEIHAHGSVWSVRIGMHWRALADRNGDDVTWFWIGSHADYDRLIR